MIEQGYYEAHHPDKAMVEAGVRRETTTEVWVIIELDIDSQYVMGAFTSRQLAVEAAERLEAREQLRAEEENEWARNYYVNGPIPVDPTYE